MKKLFTTLAIAVAMLAAIPSQAQVSWGVRAGANLVNMKMSSDVLGSKNNAGFYAGPTVKFTVPIIGLSFDASALYDQRTAKVTEGDVENEYKQQTIQIPINIRYGWGLSSLANVFLFAGPQFGFNIGNTNLYEATTTFKKEHMCVSWNIGGGVTLGGHLELGVLYNFGISDYYKLEGNSDYNFKGNTFQVQAAYLF